MSFPTVQKQTTVARLRFARRNHVRPCRVGVWCLRLWLAVLAGSVVCFARDFSFFEPVQPPRPFQVMVHRGEAGQAPENTRPALLRCIEDGLEWAEVDVRLTRDGQHILSHDSQVKGVRNGEWRVS